MAMNVGELFHELSSGELRNLYMGTEGSGAIQAEDQARIVVFANRALSRMFARFVARRMFIDLVQHADRKTYPIRTSHVITNTPTSELFLQDSADDPFTDRLVKIIAVRPAPTDEEPSPAKLAINDNSDDAVGGIKLLAYDKMRFDAVTQDAVFCLELQMDHEKLTLPPDEEQEINIPPMLIEALQTKIAADLYGSMNGAENLNKSVMLNNAYEGLLKLVEDQDLLQTTSTFSGNRLTIGGFR